MIGLISRFLPSLVPGLGAFFNPWVLAAGMAAIGGSFLYGLKIGHERMEAFQSQVEAVGAAQNAKTAATTKAWKDLKETSDAKAQTLAADRAAALARVRALQSAAASRSLLPAPTTGAAGSNRICFAADQLDRGLRETVARVAGRAVAIAQEGQRGIDTAVTCREWANAIVKP
jgi:hypothetical protein